MAIRQSGMNPIPSSECFGNGVPSMSVRFAGLELPFLDLSGYAGAEKERLTLEAMQRGGQSAMRC